MDKEEITEELARLGYGEYSQQTISRVIGKHTQNCKLAEMSKPSELKLYTVWNFPKLSEDQLRYPGQLQALVRLAKAVARLRMSQTDRRIFL